MTSLAQVYMLLCIFLLPHEETHLLWYAEKAIILLYTRTSWIKHWRVGLSGNRQYWACAAHQGDSYRNRLSAPSLYSYPVARAVCLLFISLADHLAARLRYSSLITPIRICEASSVRLRCHLPIDLFAIDTSARPSTWSKAYQLVFESTASALDFASLTARRSRWVRWAHSSSSLVFSSSFTMLQ